ncbi:hypothetical protein PI125_g6988 [Phytophthora idaei]|nr:hypothetical protein PI125_g6988 [Phytophthora idaei]
MIASFLQRHDIRFAAAKIKKHSYNKKVAGALYVLGSTGGYREVSAAMGMSRSYVMEITFENYECLLNTIVRRHP